MNTKQTVVDADRVVLAHGGGGALTDRLIRDVFLPELENDALSALTDSAVLPWAAGDVVFTTDSYVVTPLEFPGGDIGRIAVAGTVNDLAVMGAMPVALSLGLIIEEGLPIETLRRILSSIGETCREAGVHVVTGDTKVVEHRGDAGLFINTAGVGYLRPGLDLSLSRVEPGDAVLVTGTIADHGLAIMSVRNDIRFETELRSDAAPLNGLLAGLFSSGSDVKFIRDATRGGIAGVLADISEHGNLTVEVDECELPISATARHAAEMLGLDPLTVANEGKCVCVVAGRDAEKAMRALRSHPLGQRAAIIGRVTDARPALVELNTSAGGRRIVQRPYGEELPRIC
ncbi:MAG: hydrogenase expression/formation protein HypE [Planctomycetota bacterium]